MAYTSGVVLEKILAHLQNNTVIIIIIFVTHSHKDDNLLQKHKAVIMIWKGLTSTLLLNRQSQ